jgi:cytidylate kinase
VIVAIDGPAGAGKSTVSRAVARRLGMGYLDTGAMYRAVTLAALRRGIRPDDGPALAALAASLPIRLVAGDDGLRVMVGPEDVSEAIRAQPVTEAVSEVAAHPEVRAALVATQRKLLARGDWVADGRDIGTTVCPDADVKIFLTASPEVRARRRRGDLAALGVELTVDQVQAEIARRDLRDSTRAASPLRRAPDAVEVDTTAMSVEEVVERVADVILSARERR